MLNNKDLLGKHVKDLDIIWYGNEYGVHLACVKQVVTHTMDC